MLSEARFFSRGKGDREVDGVLKTLSVFLTHRGQRQMQRRWLSAQIDNFPVAPTSDYMTTGMLNMSDEQFH